MLKLVLFLVTNVSSPLPFIFHYVLSLNFVSGFEQIQWVCISKLNKGDENTKCKPFDVDKTIFKNIFKDVLKAKTMVDEKDTRGVDSQTPQQKFKKVINNICL